MGRHSHEDQPATRRRAICPHAPRAARRSSPRHAKPVAGESPSADLELLRVVLAAAEAFGDCLDEAAATHADTAPVAAGCVTQVRADVAGVVLDAVTTWPS